MMEESNITDAIVLGCRKSSDVITVNALVDDALDASYVSDSEFVADLSLKSCMKRDSSSPEASGRTVRFETVEFREYPVTLCDNPCPVAGPPVGLSWRHAP
eukprot:CAMPEP_0172562412 /NCGR_PEP_ID=MMETSP1067-20121228/96758_1 /TAXON_ID=265564 ORGANISM="Thalassiosira punctigera, Strain Tpunct2005C2" /NCGR_SAMPLE_ID=MMETSP1067 /ASSEMBLY_ACC=CAM_ASM_000444 /LENGTH=100 /DNA_ID=CAMNT_0013352623 /DNA_START=36 /DNA_END=334 /DNA_ORIENTATION=+